MRVRRRERTGAPPAIHAPGFVAEGAQLGLDPVVGVFCFVATGAVVGAGTRIQSHTSVWDGVSLGEDVFVGPSVVFTNVGHPRAAFPRAPSAAARGERPQTKASWDRTVVEDGATLGAGAAGWERRGLAPRRVRRSGERTDGRDGQRLSTRGRLRGTACDGEWPALSSGGNGEA
jgi:hypothetical protein